MGSGERMSIWREGTLALRNEKAISLVAGEDGENVDERL